MLITIFIGLVAVALAVIAAGIGAVAHGFVHEKAHRLDGQSLAKHDGHADARRRAGCRRASLDQPHRGRPSTIEGNLLLRQPLGAWVVEQMVPGPDQGGAGLGERRLVRHQLLGVLLQLLRP